MKAAIHTMALLGIDTGTTGSRALVLDEAGRTVSASAEHEAFRSPQTGWAEQDPDDWWRACQTPVPRALDAGGGGGAAGPRDGPFRPDDRARVLGATRAAPYP